MPAASAPPVARTVAALRDAVAAWRRADETVALVPTMGALHEGHLALVRSARARCRRVIVTLFVNPTQFAPEEDLAAYPRDEAADAAKLAPEGVDLLYTPAVNEIYPPGFATTVAVARLSEHFCGPFRPGHFQGVATVVTKLLLQALPDVAFFGEKDWQQLQIIRRLVLDLDIPVAVAGVPTVREPDGLALSSRNTYLKPQERRVAASLNRTLRRLAAEASDPRTPCAVAAERARAALLEAGFTAVDYVAVADALTLEPLARADRPARAFAAARIGRTRLIDNVPVQAPDAG
jgi:pantoate--beta-alanine ligase